MDEERLASLLQNMQEIETEVNKYCQQWVSEWNAQILPAMEMK